MDELEFYDGAWTGQEIDAGIGLTGTLANALAIVVDGNKSTVSVTIGQFVLVRNSTITGVADGLYKAALSIPANTTIDATYLSAISGGGLNSTRKTKVNQTRAGISASANTFTYTGLSVTIPAKSYFSVLGKAVYNQNYGTGVALSQSQSVTPPGSGADRRFIYGYSDGDTVVSVSGYTHTQLSLYLWGRWVSTGTNHEAALQGWYEPAE